MSLCVFGLTESRPRGGTVGNTVIDRQGSEPAPAVSGGAAVGLPESSTCRASSVPGFSRGAQDPEQVKPMEG